RRTEHRRQIRRGPGSPTSECRCLKSRCLEPCAEASQFDGATFRLPEQKNSYGKKREVGEPNPGGRGKAPLLGERDSDQRKRIVEEDQQNGQDKSAGLAAFLGRQAEWDADQSEHDAGGWRREAAMVFDHVPAAGDRVAGLRAAEEVGKLDLAECCRFMFLIVLCRVN